MSAHTQLLLVCLGLLVTLTNVRAADTPPLPVTDHLVMQVSPLQDLNGWAQGLRCEIYNADPKRAVALVVHDHAREDISIAVYNTDGFPVHERRQAIPIVDYADNRQRGYRYQIIQPLTSFVTYVEVPKQVVDRSAAASADHKIIPIPADTYMLKFSSAFTATVLAEGVSSYAEDQSKPPGFVRVGQTFPSSLTLKIDHERLVSDFALFVCNTLKGEPGVK